MKTLLFFLVALFTMSQSVAQEGEKRSVSIQDFPKKVYTYSVHLTYYDGEEHKYSRGKKYIEDIFPQLSHLELVQEGGDIQVKIFCDRPIELSEVLRGERYTVLFKRYEKIHPILPNTPPNTVRYFQPLVISVERKDTSLYTIDALGRYFSRELLAKTSSPDIPIGIIPTNTVLRSAYPERETERKNVLENLNFMRIHLFDLTQ